MSPNGPSHRQTTVGPRLYAERSQVLARSRFDVNSPKSIDILVLKDFFRYGKIVGRLCKFNKDNNITADSTDCFNGHGG